MGLCLAGGRAGVHGPAVSAYTTASAATSGTDAALQARLQGIYDQVDAFQGIDVRVEQQVEEELRTSDEPNLLSE
jgi:hypothetical protein